MKLKLITALGLATGLANAATSTSLANFSLPTAAVAIVDNAGNPIAAGSSTIQFGSFTDAFAATLGGLDTLTADQAVIDAFTPSGNVGAFSADGMFGVLTDTDGTGDLGRAATDNGAYALITYNSPDGVEAMVLSFGQAFPEQDDTNNAELKIDGIVGADNVAFGNPALVPSNNSGLPVPFQGFDQGLTFNAIPEPSTGLLSLIAGLGLLARRRR